MLGRRNFLGTVGATAVGASAAQALGGLEAATPVAQGAPDGIDPVAQRSADQRAMEEQLAKAGLHARARFGGCEVLSLERRPDGAVGVWLADGKGQAFAIELLAFDGGAVGVARAGSLAVYMKNKGDGVAATVEEHGLAAMAMAEHLARREAEGVELPRLPTLTGRTKAGLASA